MTKPIAFGMRVERIWYVCVLGRYGTGPTIEAAVRAAGVASS